MAQLNISRKTLSKNLDISLSSVAAYLNGQHKIRKIIALSIQAYYGVNADWLLHNKQPVFLKEKKNTAMLSDSAIEIAITFSSLTKESQKTLKAVTECLYIADVHKDSAKKKRKL